MEVELIMSAPVFWLEHETNIEETAKFMDKKNIGAVLVKTEQGDKTQVDDMGVVTERDIIRKVVSKGLVPGDVRLKDIMSTPLIWVAPDSNLMSISQEMDRQHIRRIFISDGQKIFGIVTQTDIVKNIRYSTARRLVKLDTEVI